MTSNDIHTATADEYGFTAQDAQNAAEQKTRWPTAETAAVGYTVRVRRIRQLLEQLEGEIECHQMMFVDNGSKSWAEVGDLDVLASTLKSAIESVGGEVQ